MAWANRAVVNFGRSPISGLQFGRIGQVGVRNWRGTQVVLVDSTTFDVWRGTYFSGTFSHTFTAHSIYLGLPPSPPFHPPPPPPPPPLSPTTCGTLEAAKESQPLQVRDMQFVALNQPTGDGRSHATQPLPLRDAQTQCHPDTHGAYAIRYLSVKVKAGRQASCLPAVCVLFISPISGSVLAAGVALEIPTS